VQNFIFIGQVVAVWRSTNLTSFHREAKASVMLCLSLPRLHVIIVNKQEFKTSCNGLMKNICKIAKHIRPSNAYDCTFGDIIEVVFIIVCLYQRADSPYGSYWCLYVHMRACVCVCVCVVSARNVKSNMFSWTGPVVNIQSTRRLHRILASKMIFPRRIFHESPIDCCVDIFAVTPKGC
jgi:hypothetical protein